MRQISILLVMLLSGILAYSQETAMDFTRTDCEGTEHHLFSELDEGKVVILDYIMLGCAPCIWATRNLDTIVQSYEANYPGRVKLYAFSYESSFTCEQMMAWRTDGGFPSVRLFTDGASQVAYYGGMGMPTIVVTGGKDHKVYYNSYGYTPNHDPLIIAALDSALNYSSAGITDIPSIPAPIVYPTAFQDYLTVSATLEMTGKSFVLSDISGKVLLEVPIHAEGDQRIEVSQLIPGFYFGYMKGDGATSRAVKLVKR